MTTFVNLAALCNFCILSNLLDPHTYSFADLPNSNRANTTHLSQRQEFDYNALSPSDRIYFSYVRGLSYNLLRWVHCTFWFIGEDGKRNDFLSLARTYLHQQVKAIIKYKKRAEASKVIGIPNCSASDMIRQVGLLFDDAPPEFGGLSLSNIKDDTLAWQPEVKPEKRPKPLLFEGKRIQMR